MKKSLIWMILALIVPFAFVAMAAKSETSTEKGDESIDWPSSYSIAFNTESDGFVTVTLETSAEAVVAYLWDRTDRTDGGFDESQATLTDGKWTAKTLKAYETGKVITVCYMIPRTRRTTTYHQEFHLHR